MLHLVLDCVGFCSGLSRHHRGRKRCRWNFGLFVSVTSHHIWVQLERCIREQCRHEARLIQKEHGGICCCSFRGDGSVLGSVRVNTNFRESADCLLTRCVVETVLWAVVSFVRLADVGDIRQRLGVARRHYFFGPVDEPLQKPCAQENE